MRRRPLNERFGQRVLDGIKTTTIRDDPWPIGVPIMLFHWSARPYHSPQINLAPVMVEEVFPIRIAIGSVAGSIIVLPPNLTELPLWQCEGFDSQDDMDRWFIAKMKPGKMVDKYLIRFRLIDHPNQPTP